MSSKHKSTSTKSLAIRQGYGLNRFLFHTVQKCIYYVHNLYNIIHWINVNHFNVDKNYFRVLFFNLNFLSLFVRGQPNTDTQSHTHRQTYEHACPAPPPVHPCPCSWGCCQWRVCGCCMILWRPTFCPIWSRSRWAENQRIEQSSLRGWWRK